jgi:hypothetical protein
MAQVLVLVARVDCLLWAQGQERVKVRDHWSKESAEPQGRVGNLQLRDR